MNSEELAAALHAEAVKDLVATYERLLRTSEPTEATDSYWQDLLGFYGALDGEGRQMVLRVMHQTSVDAVSSALSLLEARDESRDWLDVQDTFLVLEEERLSST
ncbi:MAG: hypothetical protein NWP98_10585 [Erythrobacter sp.]|nr:hypothetical protein [Erythrobacter sp.]